MNILLTSLYPYMELIFVEQIICIQLCHVCHRYEDEINKRNNLENDFVILKKVRVGTQTHSLITYISLF